MDFRRLNKPTQPAYLQAAGVVTPVGLNVEQTAAAIRAGISAYEDSAIYNKQLNPMTLALLPEDALPELNAELATIPGLTARQIRLLRIAHLALHDLQQKTLQQSGANLTQLPLFLAGPENLPGQPNTCYAEMIDHLGQQSGIAFDLEHSLVLPIGRAGGLLALHYAMAYLQAGYANYAIVGGIETYLDLYLLGSLDMEDRILAEGVMDGFAPGEGAGFLLITQNPEHFTDSGQRIKLYPPGIAKESGHRFNHKTPYQGDGLSQAFSLASNHTDLTPAKTIMTSLNGENFGAKELGVAVIRNQGKLDINYRTEHPADCFGDIGAASGPVQICLSVMGIIKNYLPYPILNYCSSERAHRAATYISR